MARETRIKRDSLVGRQIQSLDGLKFPPLVSSEKRNRVSGWWGLVLRHEHKKRDVSWTVMQCARLLWQRIMKGSPVPLTRDLKAFRQLNFSIPHARPSSSTLLGPFYHLWSARGSRFTSSWFAIRNDFMMKSRYTYVYRSFAAHKYVENDNGNPGRIIRRV